MRSYFLTIEGITPLLMHRDNLEFQALVNRWQRDPVNRDKSVPGDDRSPAWRWIGSLYEDGVNVSIPTDCLMASAGGAGTKMRPARGRGSLKAETQSGMLFTEPFMKLLINGGGSLPMAGIKDLLKDEDFDVHLLRARELGFALDVRRVKPPGASSKHVRVRPVFDTWAASGTVQVSNEILTKDVLDTLWFIAGDNYGILEWRPDPRMKRPGPFGRFRAMLKAA